MNNELRLALLKNVLWTITDETLSAFNRDSEHRVHIGDGSVDLYEVMDECPPDGSIILRRDSDDQMVRVSFTVEVMQL